jgi:hypothetical protein
MYDKEMKILPAFIRSEGIQCVSMDVDVQYYWLSRYIATYEGVVDTWDYQWCLAVHRQDGLCICPQVNLVSNIGFGKDATHTREYNSSLSKLARFDLDGIAYTELVEVDQSADWHEYDKLFDVKCKKCKNQLIRWRKRITRRLRMKRKISEFQKRCS